MATPASGHVNSASVIRVLCVDDHPIVRKGIASLLANESDLELVAEAASGQEAVDLHRALQPDVTLMDLKLPDLDGVTATRMIREEFPQARIIALTSYDGDQEITGPWKRARADICSKRWFIPMFCGRFAWCIPGSA